MNRRTPPETLRLLASAGETSIDAALASNWNTPADLIKAFARSAERDVVEGVAQNRAIGPETAAFVVAGGDPKCLAHLADNPSTPPELIVSIYESNPERFSWHAAANPSTPPETLRQIFVSRRVDSEENWSPAPTDWGDAHLNEGHERVISNPNCPDDLLREMLSDDVHFETRDDYRLRAASNPGLAPDIIADLARMRAFDSDDEIVVIQRLLGNPSLTDEARAILIHHPFLWRQASIDLAERRDERIRELGLDPENAQAVEHLGDRWGSLSDDDPEVALLRAMYPAR